jgi:hypothetical protein
MVLRILQFLRFLYSLYKQEYKTKLVEQIFFTQIENNDNNHLPNYTHLDFDALHSRT